MHEYRDEELAQALSELPIPTTSADFYTRLRGRITRTRLRQRRMPGRRLVAAAALVGVALVVGGIAGAEFAGSTRAATSTPVPAFTPAIGWNTVETNTSGTNLAWAANVPFEPQDTRTTWPMSTLRNLAPDGIVIVVVGPFAPAAGDEVPNLKTPVRVEDMSFHANNYETQPAPTVSYYLSVAHLGTQELNVDVWMGRNDPTPAMKAAADEELARLTLPS
jgi:hypothetical protein